jgi:very-short-patch-repair endonuclease
MAAGNLISVSETLKLREEWKYTKLAEFLNAGKRKFEFEFEIDGAVFDLVLFDTHVLVEFDGDYHRGQQLLVDHEKEEKARRAGFVIVRRKTPPSVVVDPSVLGGL